MSCLSLIFTFLSAAHSADFVSTPRGFLPRASVHRVQSQQAIRARGDHHEILDASGAKLLETAPPLMQPFSTVNDNGWVTYTIWPVPQSDSVLSFTTTWEVPPLPLKRDDQIVYLFSGFEDVNGAGILQPVLSWTKEDQWSISSWFVSAQNTAFQTPPIHVQPGQKLTGLLRGSRADSGEFNYSVEFAGIAGTTLYARNVPEMRYLVETLEAYTVTDCANYPTGIVQFRDIGVQTVAGHPLLNWSVVNLLTNCGQHTVLRPTGAGSNLVEIGFSHQP